MKLSIILPTIRLNKIPELYKSLQRAYEGELEIIIVSPYPMTDEISFLEGIQYIEDWGNPVRCQQLALEHCTGEYVHRAVDDSFYPENSLTESMNLATPQSAVSLKFTESNKTIDFSHHSSINMFNDEFYSLFYHKQTLCPYVAHDYKLINFGIYPIALLRDIGGWDAVTWETIALAELDLSIRLQFKGIPIAMTPKIAIRCDWMPGTEGDHAPLHYAFDDDMVKYRKIYSDAKCWDRVNIPCDNWKHSPDRWIRRFGKVG